MKRSNELRPLSVEHHHALFQVLQLKKVLKGELDSSSVIRSFLEAWDSTIEKHFHAEEVFLLPMFMEKGRGEQPLVERTLREHRELRSLVKRLESEEERRKQLMQDIAEKLESHIRFEERELFEAVEKALFPEELKTLGIELHRVCRDYDESQPSSETKSS